MRGPVARAEREDRRRRMVVDSQTEPRATIGTIATRRPRTRRNPKWIALGIIAICLGAIASFVLYSQVTESHQVVIVRHSLHRGATIDSSDLGSVTVGNTGGVDTVPATTMPHLVGRIAATDLVQGSLLPPGATTGALPPAHGNAVIGVHLATGRAPAGFLAPGSPIRMVVLPVGAGKTDVGGAGASNIAGGGSGAGQGELTNVATISAVVLSTTVLDDGILVNVELDAGQAVDAASYAAQDRVVVVRESER